MQLFLNATSPFARVARVAALEKALATPLELIWSDPWGEDPALLATHPQRRIPVLVTDAGEAISESLLIVQYLNGQGRGPDLLPPATAGAALAATSVAYGLMEAAFNLVIARKYDGAAADASVMGQRRLAAIARVLAQLENAPPAAVDGALQLPDITTAVALDYVRFRLPELLPTAQYPRLHAWLAQALQQPSLDCTRFA